MRSASPAWVRPAWTHPVGGGCGRQRGRRLLTQSGVTVAGELSATRNMGSKRCKRRPSDVSRLPRAVRSFGMRRIALAALFVAAAAACPGPGPVGITLPDAETRILFVGNSLTATNDLPGLVQALGQGAGRSVAVASVVRANYALEDHWRDGLEAEIQRLAADFVILQQGPSSLPASRDNLVAWTLAIAPAVRGAGGEPVLLMVWPDRSRAAYFDEVRDSYYAAAKAVDGRFVPGGWSWVEAWSRDAELDLWGPDGFHPSYLGTLTVAYTLVTTLLDLDPDAIRPRDDGVPDSQLSIIREAVAASVDAWAK